MTWLLILVIVGVVVTVALWAMFAYIAVREMKAEMPRGAFAPALSERLRARQAPMKILLPIDGSEASIVAVQEIAHCALPPESTIELLYAIHSRLPVIPDFPPSAVTIAAAHGESIREQTIHAPEVLAAAERYLQAHQSQAAIVTKIVEGVPRDEILREAADAPCTVHIARAPRGATQSFAGAHA